jgi:hypothetical protein
MSRASASITKFARSLVAGSAPDTECSAAQVILKTEAWRLAVAEAGEQESSEAANVQAAERAINTAIADALRTRAEALVEKYEASGAFNDLAEIIGLTDAVGGCDPLNPMLRAPLGLPSTPYGYSLAIVRAAAVCARVDTDRVDIRSPKILHATARYTAQVRSLMPRTT